MKYTVRPLSDRTWLRPPGTYEFSPFRASWQSTLRLLAKELEHLSARNPVLEVDVTEGAIRQDGMLYARTKASSPAVRIAFESKFGPLIYSSDLYVGRWHGDPPDWQHNVRAIALGLEALRAVDRYGVTGRGEQYAGWKAIEGPKLTDPAEVIRSFAPAGLTLQRALKHAQYTTHPDRNNGKRDDWDRVMQAAFQLGLT